MMATREPIPTYPYGKEENRILYDRFHALKHKASHRGALFAWNKFSEFIEDVMQKAPAGYVPSAYRMYFELDEDDPQYNAETMRFAPGRALQRSFRSPRPAKSTFHAQAMNGLREAKSASALAILLLTEEGTPTELAGLASEIIANEERDNEQDLDEYAEDDEPERAVA